LEILQFVACYFALFLDLISRPQSASGMKILSSSSPNTPILASATASTDKRENAASEQAAKMEDIPANKVYSMLVVGNRQVWAGMIVVISSIHFLSFCSFY
jgi:hypothetical protein